ncbi:MAG: hypothetical protein GY941_29420 [Planctomycetes bacterium]|nr:hypothetical protein [Planctomycetota bacterium]
MKDINNNLENENSKVLQCLETFLSFAKFAEIEITEAAIAYFSEEDYENCAQILSNLKFKKLKNTEITVNFLAKALKRFCFVDTCMQGLVGWNMIGQCQQCHSVSKTKAVYWCCQSQSNHSFCNICYLSNLQKSSENKSDKDNNMDNSKIIENTVSKNMECYSNSDESIINNQIESTDTESIPDSDSDFDMKNESENPELVIAKLAKKYPKTHKLYKKMNIVKQLKKMNKSAIIPLLSNVTDRDCLNEAFYHIFYGAQFGMNKAIPEHFTVKEMWKKYGPYIEILHARRRRYNFRDLLPFDLAMLKNAPRWQCLSYLGICAMPLKKPSIITKTVNGVIMREIENTNQPAVPAIQRHFLIEVSEKILDKHFEMEYSDTAICSAKHDQNPVAFYTLNLSFFIDWRLDEIKHMFENFYWKTTFNKNAKKSQMRIVGFGTTVLTTDAKGGQCGSESVNSMISGILLSDL